MSEFSELFGEWGADSTGTPTVVGVETRAGGGAWGDELGAVHEVEGVVLFYGNRVVRDAAGNELTSTATLYVELGSDADRFTLGSMVTLPPIGVEAGRRTKVAMVSAPDVYGLFGFRSVALE